MITEEEAEAILEMRKQSAKVLRRKRLHGYLLAGILRCKCGAPMNGSAGFYRCRDRCGMRSVKHEALDGAVIGALMTDFLTESVVVAMQKEAAAFAKTFRSEAERERDLVGQQVHKLDKEIHGLVAVLSQMTNKRPVLERLDQLEAERMKAAERLAVLSAEVPTVISGMSKDDLAEFLDEFRNGLLDPDAEKRKSMLRSLLDSAELQGDTIALMPATQPITGFKMALPPEFEPGFKP